MPQEKLPLQRRKDYGMLRLQATNPSLQPQQVFSYGTITGLRGTTKPASLMSDESSKLLIIWVCTMKAHMLQKTPNPVAQRLSLSGVFTLGLRKSSIHTSLYAARKSTDLIVEGFVK